MKLFLAALSLTLFLGCASIGPQDFAAKSPRFVPEQYFTRKLRGQGIFFDRSKNARTSFTIDLDGTWDGEVLTLNELLRYETGETLTRVYTMKKIDDHRYEATTPDVVGVATIESYGNVLRWKYRLRQDVGGGSIWTLSFDDWMFLQPDGTVLNRATASKFGFEVGEVFMVVSPR